jgi:hypothetical protein
MVSTSYRLVQRPKPDHQGIKVTLGNHVFDMHKLHIKLIGELPVVMKLEYSVTLKVKWLVP